MSLSVAEWLDYAAALTYVRSTLTASETRALERVKFRPSEEATSRRGFFWGVQARRDPRLVDRLVEGSRADGLVTIFVRSHPPGDLSELAVTIHHEIDHALGGNEREVLDRADRRGPIDARAVEAWRPQWQGLRLKVLRPPVAPERPLRIRPPAIA